MCILSPVSSCFVVHKEDNEYRQMLRDELIDESVIEKIQSLEQLTCNNDNGLSGIATVFYLVYCHIPRRMKTKLRSVDDKDITMTEYFEQFPVTLEALILMMFQTVPDYLKGYKFNKNKAIEEDRHTSTSSGDSTVSSENEKKKGGRPADKAGFVLETFQDYLERAVDRREFHFPPDEEQYKGQKEAYEMDKADWNARKANLEFAHDEELYNMALRAINDKNRESRTTAYVNIGLLTNVTNSAGQNGASNANASSRRNRKTNNKRAGRRYDDKRSKKLQRFDPLNVPMNDLDDKVKQVTATAAV
jgi:hypothetical protein